MTPKFYTASQRPGDHRHHERPLPAVSDRNAWEGAIYREIERALDCTTSDAQGIADAQPFTMAQQWALGADPIAAATAIIKAGSVAP